MATTPSRAPAARPRQYRRILTSTLHRKFVHASAVSLVACYVVAFFIGVKSSFFWSWFPLGACGFRTLLLFISCLAIFILRVGQMHVGARTTSSAFSSTRQALFSFSTFQTFGWYLVSAWWFSEVYMWSSSESAELNWVKPGRPYERAKLNERPIYLHCFYALLAITQSIFHLYFDWDKIHIPVSKRSANSANHSVLLVTLWQVSNLLFSTFLGQAPLKKGQPLTNESKDPNGSLINGLKAKRDVVRTFAFWELCLIGQQFPERRKAIFADIDRNGGSAWTQILGASTNVIKGITARINEHQNPTTLPAADSSTVSGKTSDSSNMDGQPTTIHTLPRLTSAPKGDNIFLASSKPTTRPEQFESAFGSVAKSYGQSPNWTPAARNQARNIFNRATTAVLSPEQRKRISASAQELKLLTCSSSSSSSSGRPRTHPLIHQFLSSLAGLPFRRSYTRRLRIIILGKPYASLSPIIDAVESLTRLLIASMAEDQFGKVQADIAAVVRLFTETAMALESFTGAGEGGLDVHWTDVDFPPADAEMEIQKKARRVEEVEMIKEALKGGLAELLEAFKLYLDDVGIRGKELRMAREAAGLV
ncbi:nuclear envelope protein [Blastomyces gilchristii SLH14081]|uniref:Nuclear envelope protein n=1 Tax=Blastomyces gilchristii (strain SLH14081) TaxID=559298 RepID=A0A179UEK5_BLAGS|nr:nuclear envelope protein [Blastomyces gilchristii SLH14081]OAT06446.1 nuclear envelope protein [Blastomyces gilchristii SLH14081]